MVAVIVVAVLLVAAYVTYKTFYGKIEPVVAKVESIEAKAEETVQAVVTEVETKV